MSNVLEKYLDGGYTFTPYIPELVKSLNKNKGLILANLLTKLAAFNPDKDVQWIYGKEFHFYFSKKDIAEKELLIDYSDFNRYMKELSEYVTAFGSRQKGDKGYNTTYFYLHLDKVQALFKEGAKMLGKKIKKQVVSEKQAPKSYTKRLPENIANALKAINETELKHQKSEISDDEYKQTILPLKGLIMSNKYNITNNKDNKIWEVTL
jgi:hypothetical protein